MSTNLNDSSAALQKLKTNFQDFESHFTAHEKETFAKIVAFSESLRNGANPDSFQNKIDSAFQTEATDIL